jgi:hypothetical protein
MELADATQDSIGMGGSGRTARRLLADRPGLCPGAEGCDGRILDGSMRIDAPELQGLGCGGERAHTISVRFVVAQ